MLVAAAGLGSHWGSREELLHPRDSHGRFRSKWKMAEGVVDKIMSFLDRFDPYTFPDDNAAAEYGLARQSQRAKRDSKAMGQIRRFMRSYASIQQELRAGHSPPPEVRDFDANKEAIPNDLILSRVVGPEAFGLTPETLAQIEEYTGKLVSDRGYQSSSLGTPMGYGPGKILVTIAAPAGTQAMFPHGREVVLDRDTPLRITKVDPDGQGGFYVLAVAEPDATERTKRLGGRAPAVTPASKTDVGEPRPVGTPPAATPQGERVPAPAPGPAPNTHPGTEVPAPRSEPVVSESIGGGAPSTPEAPAAAPEAPAAPETPEAAPQTSFRQAVRDAKLTSPASERRGLWNKVFLRLDSGKMHPEDAARDLNSDIKHFEEEVARNKERGVDDPTLSSDIEAYKALRDLVEEHYGLRPAEEEKAPEAPKRRRGGGGSLRNVEPEEKKAIRESQRERGIRKEAPAKAVEPVQIPGPNEEARRIIDEAGGGEPQTDMGKVAINLFTDKVARKKTTRKQAAKQLRDFADSGTAGEDADLVRRVADVIDPPKMAAKPPAKAAAKKAAPKAPEAPTKAPEAPSVPETHTRALADIKAAPDMESRAGAEAVRDARFKIEAGGDPAEVAADLRRRAASIKRRQMTNDDVLTGRVQHDPDSLKAMRDTDVRNLNDLADNLSPRRPAKKAVLEKAVPAKKATGVPTSQVEVGAGRKPTLDEIRGMKVAELRAEAKKHGVKIRSTRKADIAEELAQKLDLKPGGGEAPVQVPVTPTKAVPVPDLDDDLKTTIPNLRKIAQDEGIDVPKKLRLKADIQNHIHEQRRNRPTPTTAFKEPELPEVPEVPATKTAAKKAAQTILVRDDELARIVADNSPEQLREVARQAGVDVPDDMNDKNLIITEIARHVARQELISRKRTQARATKKVTEALEPASPSVDLEELTKDLDPQLLAARSATLDRVREGLLDPKKSPAQVGRDLEGSVRAIQDSAAIRYGGWQARRRPEPEDEQFRLETKLKHDQMMAEAGELQKLADRLKTSRRKPAKKVTTENKAIQRQNRIDRARLWSEPAEHLDKILERGATADSVRRNMSSFVDKNPDLRPLVDDVVRRLEAHESTQSIRDAIRRELAKQSLEARGTPGHMDTFDPQLHDSLDPGTAKGDRVVVQSPGTWYTDPVTGEKIQLSRAVVRKIQPARPVRSASGSNRVTDENGRIIKRDRPNADQPLYLPNGGVDQGRVHLDSELGSLWADLYADDRLPNSVINELAHVGEDVGLSNMGLEDAIKVLRRMAAEAPDEMIRDRIERTIQNLDSPRVTIPDIPGVPDAVMRYLRELERIPTMRIRHGRVGVSDRRGESVLDEVIALIRKINDGEVSPFRAETQLRERRVHESFDGGVTSWGLAERLFTPTLSRWDPTAKNGKGDFVSEPNPEWPAIRDWIRNARRNRSS